MVDGEVVQRVLPRDFQIHPFRPKAIAINWMRYVPGTYPGARIDIPLKAINEERCPGIKEGGWLLELQETVSGGRRAALSMIIMIARVSLPDDDAIVNLFKSFQPNLNQHGLLITRLLYNH